MTGKPNGADRIDAAITAADSPKAVPLHRFNITMAPGRVATFFLPVDLSDTEFLGLVAGLAGPLRGQLIAARQRTTPAIAIARTLPPKLRA